jgi:hypothetical protein
MFAKGRLCLLQALESVTRHHGSHPSSPDKHRLCSLNFGYKKWLAFAKPNITKSNCECCHLPGRSCDWNLSTASVRMERETFPLFSIQEGLQYVSLNQLYASCGLDWVCIR